ncbi:unnamed protein product [Urochloa decumbens]|uniref:Uncharacterized protein n=1 Tax=Urochloa decumbens TaxID=240449 RepID=A0ABC9BM52_9POAL
MATAAKESSAAAAAARQQEEAEALFEEKHAELVAEARRVAREHGADVRTVAFRPGGAAAVQHDFLGIPMEERVVGRIRRAVSRDVSAMGAEELAAHQRQLRIMKAVVERELQAKEAAAAAAAKRAAEQKEAGVAGAGESKVQRIIIE